MKRVIFLLCILSLLLCGCYRAQEPAQIAATTLPVYEFTSRLCSGTDLSVTRLVTDNVSCLHDYSLNVKQVKAAESARLIVISGAGLEEFMEDILADHETIDASYGVDLLESCHTHDDNHEHTGDHTHNHDAHIWLSPANARIMATNICAGLIDAYPQHKAQFEANLSLLLSDIDTLIAYGEMQLSTISHRQIITFHDGFSYLAQSYGLTILDAIEEESGSEASAAELIEIIDMLRQHQLTAIFTETNGSVAAADIISAETGAKIFALDMAMSGNSWFEAMYHNIDTLKEALE